MFDGYRKLLEIVCTEEWVTAKNHDELERLLTVLEKVFGKKPESVVLLNLFQKLLQKAFDEIDEDLLYFIITTIISLDEILDENEKIPEGEIEGKTEPSVEKEKGSKEQIEEDDEVLSRSYGTLIKKSAVKEVLSKIKKDFSLNDLEKIITDYYRNVLKSKVNDRGLQVYTSSYKRFLINFGLCRRDNVPENPPPKKSAIVYHLTGKDIGTKQLVQKLEKSDRKGKRVDRASLSNEAQYIILWSEKNATDVIDVDAVYLHKIYPIGENYRIRDIYAGLDELVKRGIATRFSQKRFAIKKEMIKKD